MPWMDFIFAEHTVIDFRRTFAQSFGMAQQAAPFGWHRRLSPEGHAKIIHLLLIEGLSVDIVARRFGVGSTTIRRIRAAHCEKIEKQRLANDNGRN
jgi:transposase-like protein